MRFYSEHTPKKTQNTETFRLFFWLLFLILLAFLDSFLAATAHWTNDFRKLYMTAPIFLSWIVINSSDSSFTEIQLIFLRCLVFLYLNWSLLVTILLRFYLVSLWSNPGTFNEKVNSYPSFGLNFNGLFFKWCSTFI